MPRGRLIVNPEATTTSPRARDVLTHAISSQLHLDVCETKARGHAAELAFDAAEMGTEVVIVLGGDGTVNEVVNGLLANGPGSDVPALAVVPGGSTNVFARAVGVPDDQVEATGDLLEALRDGRERVIGLGRAGDRWFTFTAGLGLDADVVARVEQRRAAGRPSTHGLYVRSALAHLAHPRRQRPHLTLVLPDDHHSAIDPSDRPMDVVLVGNTSPWTYLGGRALDPFPGATFELGLDLLALSDVGVRRAVTSVARMLRTGDRPLAGSNVIHRHDLEHFSVLAAEETGFQVDGDYVGTRRQVQFQSVPKALRVLA